jgi:putative acetyltransferase
MIVQIRSENSLDHDSIRRVNRLAFGGAMEATLVDALRVGGHVTVSLVAVSQGDVVGHILFSPVTIEMTDGRTEVLSLAPMSVLPEYQRTGVGTALVEAGIKACRETAYKSVVVLGHPEFYRRFGFSPVLTQSLKSPFGDGEAWMALELVPGSLQGIAGTVVYPPPFRMFE